MKISRASLTAILLLASSSSTTLAFHPPNHASSSITSRVSSSTITTKLNNNCDNVHHRSLTEPCQIEQPGGYLNPHASQLPPRPSFPGNTFREGRVTYAPYHTANGAVGSLGTVGDIAGGAGTSGGDVVVGAITGGKIANGMSSPFTGPSIVERAASAAAAAAAGVGAPAKKYDLTATGGAAAKKSYGLGAWKKDTDAANAAALDAVVAMSVTTSPTVAAPAPIININSNTNTNTNINTRLRRPIVAGNWKLNPPTKSEAITLLKLLAANFHHHRDPTSSSPSSPEAVIFPPLPYLADAVSILSGTGIGIGAQTTSPLASGAHTGEIAPSMLASSGCSHVLIGHSERRTLYGEGDADVNARIHACLDLANTGGGAPLTIILCIGETKQEYDAGLLNRVVDTQLRRGLSGVEKQVLMEGGIVIAYEPVWAIGTGLVATKEQAQDAHVAIRNVLRSMYDNDDGSNGSGGGGVADTVRIQYGGSVTPDSIEELMSQSDVDGALVGGASLNADSFTRIFDGAASADAKKKMEIMSSSSSNSMSTVLGVRGGGFGYPPRELVAREALATKNALGESPVWSVKEQSLYWVSATEGEVWAWDLKNPPYRRLMNTAVGCIGLLQSPTPGSVLVAGESAMLTTSMISAGGNPTNPIADFATGPSILCDRPDHMTTTRPNDGRVDRFGNMVVGMYNQYHRSGPTEGENNAGLYRLNGQTLEWTEILDYKFRVSNCICFSGDGKTMYFGDTPTRRVYAFDYSPDGPLTNRRLIWTMPSNLPGGPDGAQVDSNGKLWIAVTGGGRVVQLNPETGSVEMIVHLDANPTSLTFGGEDLDELFITTRAPNGGGLYRLKMPFGVKGIPEPEFTLGSSGSSYGIGGGKKPADSSMGSYLSSL